MTINWRDVFGILFIITGIFDAIKYVWNGKKIQLVGTAKGHSRKFINVAIINDIIRLLYGVVIKDIFIILTAIVALVCMGYLFYQIYKYYPYRMRGCGNFRRPNMFLYTLNSFMPNRIRKRL
jgi:hypothetical protein